MFKKISVLASLSVLLILQSCSDSNTNSQTSGRDVLSDVLIVDNQSKLSNMLSIDGESLSNGNEIVSKLSDQQKKDVSKQVIEYRNALLVSTYLDQITIKDIDQNSMKEYFNTHKDEFSDIEVELSHILFRRNAEVSEDNIDQVFNLIKSGEMEFGDAVEKFSDDFVTKSNGGSIGWVSESNTRYGFMYKKASEFKSGEIFQVESEAGSHIVIVNSVKLSDEAKFEDVRSRLEYSFLEQLRKQALEDLK